MKIQFIFNKVQNKSLAHLGIAEYKQELEKIGYTVDLSFKDTNLTFQTYQFSSDVVGNATSIKEQDLVPLMESGNRLTIAILGSDSSNPRHSNPVQYPINKNGNTLIVIPEHWYGEYAKVLCEYLLHETAHAGFFFGMLPDRVHTQPAKYANMVNAWQIYYLDLLKELKPHLETVTKPTTMTYKYFSPREIVGLKPTLVAKLDEARGYAGIPFIIESGLRTPVQNSALPDAVSNSAHLKGLAVDLRARDSVSRWKIVNSLLKAGFTRIGIGKNFIHADIDTSLPQNVIWHYY